MVEDQAVISLKEFKAWLVGLIRGKGGQVPDMDDWKQIKKMLDKTQEEATVTPTPGSDWPVWPVWPNYSEPYVGDPLPGTEMYRWYSTSGDITITGNNDSTSPIISNGTTVKSDFTSLPDLFDDWKT